MDVNNLSKIFTEVYAILNCLDEKEKDKIPTEVWREIEKRKSNIYEYSYIPGDEQYLNDYTISMLIQIYFKYLKIK